MKFGAVRSDWTPVEVADAQARYYAENPDDGEFEGSPHSQWLLLHQLEAMRKDIEAGEGLLLLYAIRGCAKYGVAMPEWMAQEYMKVFDSVWNAKVTSWDAAFGAPYKKGAHLGQVRKRKEDRKKVWMLVLIEVGAAPNTPIDAALFERIGEKLGLKKTATEKLYYEACRLHNFSAMNVRELIQSHK